MFKVNDRVIGKCSGEAARVIKANPLQVLYDVPVDGQREWPGTPSKFAPEPLEAGCWARVVRPDDVSKWPKPAVKTWDDHWVGDVVQLSVKSDYGDGWGGAGEASTMRFDSEWLRRVAPPEQAQAGSWSADQLNVQTAMGKKLDQLNVQTAMGKKLDQLNVQTAMGIYRRCGETDKELAGRYLVNAQAPVAGEGTPRPTYHGFTVGQRVRHKTKGLATVVELPSDHRDAGGVPVMFDSGPHPGGPHPRRASGVFMSYPGYLTPIVTGKPETPGDDPPAPTPTPDYRAGDRVETISGVRLQGMVVDVWVNGPVDVAFGGVVTPCKPEGLRLLGAPKPTPRPKGTRQCGFPTPCPYLQDPKRDALGAPVLAIKEAMHRRRALRCNLRPGAGVQPEDVCRCGYGPTMESDTNARSYGEEDRITAKTRAEDRYRGTTWNQGGK